jgi:hypothetical protein
MTSCSSVAPLVRRTASAIQSDFIVWTEDLRSDYHKNSYSMMLNTPRGGISSIFVVKKTGDEWRGALVNEMGAKAFDFIVKDNKCELLNVIPMMDKWYIKRAVAADLFFLLNVDNLDETSQKHIERFEQDGIKVVNFSERQLLVKTDSIVLINRHRGLMYEIQMINETDSDKDNM